ncbi:hypothetical protein Ahy_A09g042984 [Arachis hypogaea]|uniref:FAR1 domain-containing protein n=1 Tax=Arachis hypogaea TaxID=3818 RepID=A0A445BH98_ARAHY|nr:hypothetical protein Ahy_A09g042984 [Arachis hypogaea]
MNKTFRSDEAAYEFYRRFGKCFGFGIRKGDSGKDESGRVIRRRFFCNRAGLRQRHHYDRLDRQRGHRSETCTNCEAKLSVYLDVVSDEFEAEWDDAVEKYGLQNSFWAKETFQKRMMWANAYQQDKFCAGFRTTSWYEGINAYVKNFLKSRHSLVDMVQNLELVVRVYHNNELLAQFRSLHGMPVMTTCLDPLEKYAADAYTREIFVDAKKEIVGVGAVNFVAKIRRSTTMVHTLEEYSEPGREMWRKDAKSLDKYAEIAEVGSERGFLLRHGALHAAAQWMLYVGARSPSSFTQALNGLHILCQELDRGHENVCQNKAHDTVEMHDPAVVKTKGAPRVRRQGGRKRHCTHCRKMGQTKRHCKMTLRAESSGSKIRLQDEIPATSGRSETMECKRNVISNTDDLLKQLLTQITDISSRLGLRFPA